MPEKKLEIGIIGLGKFGLRHSFCSSVVGNRKSKKAKIVQAFVIHSQESPF